MPAGIGPRFNNTAGSQNQCKTPRPVTFDWRPRVARDHVIISRIAHTCFAMPNFVVVSPHHFLSSCRFKLLNLRRYTNINRRKKYSHKPQLAITAIQSLQTVQTLLRAGMGCITYLRYFKNLLEKKTCKLKHYTLRDLLPEENFESSEWGLPTNMHLC
jgi:hypothetical protein